MNTKNKLLSAIVAVMVLASLALSGCSIFSKKPAYSVKDAIAYMEDRYDDTFTYLEDYDDHQPTGGSYDLYLKSKKFPDEKVYLRIIRSGDGFRYVDNYIAIKYCDETREAIEEIATTVYGNNFNLLCDPGPSTALSAEKDPDMSLQEFWLTKEADLACCLKIAPEYGDTNSEAELDQIEELIKEKKMCIRFSIYYTKDQDFYEATKKIDAKWNEYSTHMLIGIGPDMKTEIKNRG
ncbi:MAG: hypothetical protein J5752_09015 [Clostridiales bacterium]|nr:hypothetical protein [Clostridiales bacterium]